MNVYLYGLFATADSCTYNLVQLVAGTHLAWNLERYAVALAYLFYRFQVHAWVLKFQVNGTGCWACDKDFLSGVDFAGLDIELAYTKLREVLDGLSNVYLSLCCL